MKKASDRNEAIVGGAIGLITRRSIFGFCVVCAASSGAHGTALGRGCFLASGERPSGVAEVSVDDEDDIELDLTTGQSNVDRTLGAALVRLAGYFEVLPGVGIYDDIGQPNALAYRHSFLPPGRGTILIGRNLLEAGLANTQDGGISVVAILAHEFGHILQQHSGLDERLLLPNGAVKHKELHADFLAGLYLADVKRRLPGARLFNSGMVFHGLGETEFGNADHHGTPDERLRALEFGFRVGERHPDVRPVTAATEAVRYVQTIFPA